MTGPLRHAPFRRLWLAGFVSELGDWALLVALPVYVYQRTGSPAATATTFVVALLPGLALSPLAGVLADRYDRRALMIVVSLAQAATLLPLLTGDLVVLNVVTAVHAALAALFEPAENALLPTLVPRSEITAANGLVGVGGTLARLVGASLGGLVPGWTGLTGVVVADVASFLVAALLLAFVGTRDEPRDPGPTPWRAWLDGVRAIRGPLRPMVGVVGGMAIGQGMFVVLFVVFVAERLGGDAAEVGLLRGVQAVGGLVGGLLVGALVRRWEPGAVFGWAVVALALVSGVIWNAPTTGFAFFLGAFALVGAPGVMAGAGLASILQLHTEDDTRGRVSATFLSLFDGGQALGMTLAGVLTPVVGLSALLDGQAAVILAAGVLALTTTVGRPRVRRPAA
ncbi:MFS transporter [Actinosynnema sp. NPDC020468]|uniref:MFS transporter n=1 Tax=Actinosynnema sp. NPDC020468 TaxID=3154488 RepID=UPI0033E40AA1